MVWRPCTGRARSRRRGRAMVGVRPVCGRRSGPAVHVWAGPAPGGWSRPQVVRGQANPPHADSPADPLPRFNTGELAGGNLEQRVDGRWRCPPRALLLVLDVARVEGVDGEHAAVDQPRDVE